MAAAGRCLLMGLLWPGCPSWGDSMWNGEGCVQNNLRMLFWDSLSQLKADWGAGSKFWGFFKAKLYFQQENTCVQQNKTSATKPRLLCNYSFTIPCFQSIFSCNHNWPSACKEWNHLCVMQPLVCLSQQQEGEVMEKLDVFRAVHNCLWVICFLYTVGFEFYVFQSCGIPGQAQFRWRKAEICPKEVKINCRLPHCVFPSWSWCRELWMPKWEIVQHSSLGK